MFHVYPCKHHLCRMQMGLDLTFPILSQQIKLETIRLPMRFSCGVTAMYSGRIYSIKYLVARGPLPLTHSDQSEIVWIQTR